MLLQGIASVKKTGVRKEGVRIVEITAENGSTTRAKIFADCTL